MAKRVSSFVISPMGDDDGSVRYTIENVWTNIIYPAKAIAERKTGYQIDARPEFENVRPPDILQDIVERIVKHDLIIAVLHGSNPNVMYELGIAHSAGREVIILRHNENNLRKVIFDIDKRLQLTYTDRDLHGEQAGARGVVAKLADAMVAQIAAQAESGARIAFSNPRLDALGSRHVDYQLLKRVSGDDERENLPYARWARFFHAPTHEICIMGVSLLQLLQSGASWTLPDGRPVIFASLLQAKAVFEGTNIRIAIMDEANPALPELLRHAIDGSDQGQIDQVRDEIARAFTQWTALARAVADAPQPDDCPPKGRVQVVKIRKGLITSRVSLNDREAIMTPIFLHEVKNGAGPALIVSRNTNTYQFLRAEFDFLIEQNAAPEAAIGAARQLRRGTAPAH